MKKSFSRKNILKEASVLLIAVFMVLSTVVVTGNNFNTSALGDVTTFSLVSYDSNNNIFEYSSNWTNNNYKETISSNLSMSPDMWISYNDGYTENNMGVSEGGISTEAIELTDIELSAVRGLVICEIRVSIGSDGHGAEPGITYEVWIEQTLPADPTIVTPIAVGVSTSAVWNNIDIEDTAIPDTGDLYIGINFHHDAGKYPCGFDESITSPTRGGLLWSASTGWSDLSSIGNPGVWGLDIGVCSKESIIRTTGYENWYTYVGDGTVDVNVANGNLIVTGTDLAIDARIDMQGFVKCGTCGILVDRVYNSQSVENSPFGVGWTYNYNVYLEDAKLETISPPGNDGVVLHDGDGGSHIFIKSDNSYISPPGIHFTLIKNDDDTFTLRHKYGTESNFDMNGKLTSVVDTNKNQLSMNYDAEGRLISVLSCCGSYINLEYNSNDRITKIIDTANRVVTYDYTESGYLSKVTDSLGYSTNYTYNGDNILESITNPNGKKTIFNYQYLNDLYRLPEMSYESPAITAYIFNYDFSSKTTTVTDANGHKGTYKYDGYNRVTEITDPLGKKEAYVWDPDNNVILFTDKNSKTWDYEYDQNGNLLKVEDPLGYNSKLTYEYAFNKPISSTDENEYTTSYEYDINGNLIKTIDPLDNFETYTYDSRGNMISLKDKNDHTTLYKYDNFGHMIKVTDPQGYETDYEYDTVGNLIKEIDANEHITQHEYDLLRRPTNVINAVGDETDYSYDPVGNLIKETDTNDYETEYTYDTLDRLTKITRSFETDKSNSDDKTTYDISSFYSNFIQKYPSLSAILKPLFVGFFEGHLLLKDLLIKDYTQRPPETDYAITEYEYDPVGNIISVTDPNGYRTNYVYNDRNERIKKINSEEETVSYSYDNNGNSKTLTEPNGNVITYIYDARDKLTDVSDSIGVVSKYYYDAVGNLMAEEDANGYDLVYFYDELNRNIALVFPEDLDGDGYKDAEVYNYDPVGNLLSVTDRNGNPTNYYYDETDRLIKVIDALGYETEYEYDPVGNMIDITDVNNHATSYAYDQLNRVIRETFADGTTRKFTYDAVGNIISREDQLGQVTQYVYDDLYRVIKRDYPGSNDDSFTYDKAGRMLSANNADSKVTFVYDTADRLIQTQQNNYLIEYEYDILNGLRTIKYPVYKKSKDVSYESKIISKSNNPTYVPALLDGGSVVETSDKRGRLIDVEKTGLGVLAEYIYDDADRLLTKTYLNDVTSSYNYNGNDWVTSLQHCKSSTLIAGFNYEYDTSQRHK